MNVLISIFGVRIDVQPYLALGVGLRLPGFKQLTPEKLAQAIDAAVNDAALRTRAAALGEKIRAEDGVARAVEIIEWRAAASSVGEESGSRTREGARRTRRGRATHERCPFAVFVLPPRALRVFSRIRGPTPFS